MTQSGLMPSPTADLAIDGDYVATTLFESAPAAIFDALTTPSGLSGWWMAASGSGLEGGSVMFRWGAEGALVMRVDTAERASLVEWTALASEPINDWVGTTVRFELSATETGGTRLDFRHHGLTPQLECFDMCRKGWDQSLPSLVGYVDHGRGNPPGSRAR